MLLARRTPITRKDTINEAMVRRGVSAVSENNSHHSQRQDVLHKYPRFKDMPSEF